MSDFDLREELKPVIATVKIGAIVELQSLIAEQELTTVSQVNGLLHNIIMGDESLEDEAYQYEADARADNLTKEQFNHE